jgi:hypothetical protein
MEGTATFLGRKVRRATPRLVGQEEGPVGVPGVPHLPRHPRIVVDFGIDTSAARRLLLNRKGRRSLDHEAEPSGDVRLVLRRREPMAVPQPRHVRRWDEVRASPRRSVGWSPWHIRRRRQRRQRRRNCLDRSDERKPQVKVPTQRLHRGRGQSDAKRMQGRQEHQVSLGPFHEVRREPVSHAS